MTGYSHKERKRIDKQRDDAGTDMRRGVKKAEAVRLSSEQARQLKTGQQTPHRAAGTLC